ncbi:Hypothetical predicted protein [Xyrichtys novacula]|uniref:Uncharacterized protein n=1 Tax=Xyrichtys novacula TaxID=13765 RepID=A0AAV1GZH8_XYRNO|nr:Hypothetical predicted protein [Xyrichtys novacula]
MGLSWDEAQAKARDRVQWQCMTAALCPNRDEEDNFKHSEKDLHSVCSALSPTAAGPGLSNTLGMPQKCPFQSEGAKAAGGTVKKMSLLVVSDSGAADSRRAFTARLLNVKVITGS